MRTKAASLAVSPDTNLLASFYTHLTTRDPNFASTESQEQLSRRLRDVLLKMLAIVGGPQVLSVLMPLAKAKGETETKSAASTLNNKWSVLSSAPSSKFLLTTFQAS
jgi:hypothetical protein